MPAQGTLEPGAVIEEEAVKRFPNTEDLLAGVSLLLNGGGLQNFETITDELNRALDDGGAQQARELLTQLDAFAGGIDQQKADIVTALQGLDRLSTTLAPRMEEIDVALQRLPAGLDTLNDLEPQLVESLDALGDASEQIAPFAEDGSKQLRGILDELEPSLRAVGDVQQGSLGRALRLLPFLIFPIDAIPYWDRGDYANLVAPINLTLDSLDKNLFTGTPLSGSLSSVAEAARNNRTGADGPPVPAPTPMLGNPLLVPSAPTAPTGPGEAEPPPSPLEREELPDLPGLGN